jgi:hypothetical protein
MTTTSKPKGLPTLSPLEGEELELALANLPPRFSDRSCRHCGAEGCLDVRVIDQSEASSPHWAKCHCTACGHFVTFVSKPAALRDGCEQRKRRSQDQLKRLLTEQGRSVTRCEKCTVDLSDSLGQHMVVHHKIEVQEGGTDDPNNLEVLCVDCHTDTHTARSRIRRARGQHIRTGKSRHRPEEEEARLHDS